MGKTIILEQAAAKEAKRRMMNEAFYPDRAKVLAVKDFLDRKFKRELDDDIVGGYPSKVHAFGLLSVDGNGEILKIMNKQEVLDMVDNEFNEMITDDSDRELFLKAVIKDWYNRKISPEGILSVNVLKRKGE